ncbi:MAG: type II CAAX prenyl endopeptidase Rce1 family protein [Haloarculaceae archaeon]
MTLPATVSLPAATLATATDSTDGGGAFLGVAVVAVLLFLGLARLSQGLVRDDGVEPASTRSDSTRLDSTRPGDDSPTGDAPSDVSSGDAPSDVSSGDAPLDASPGDTPSEPSTSDAAATTDGDAAATTDGDAAATAERGDAAATADESDTAATAEGDAAATAAGDVRASGGHPEAKAEAASGERGAPLGEPTADSIRSGVERRERLDLSPGALLANVALTQGLFGALVAAAALYFGVPLAALGLGPLATGPGAVGVGVAFGAVLWLGNEGASAVADAAGAGYDEALRGMLAPDSARGWVLLLGATLPIIAGVEELLFRAALIGVPAAVYGLSPWALAAVSSVAFALGHGAQGPTGVVVTGALGFCLAAGFVLTGSLVVVVVAHYLVNALEFLVHEGLDRPDPFWR